MKRLSISVLALVLFGLVASWLAAGKLSAPALSALGPLPPDLPFKEVRFARISGWYLQGDADKSCILLLHGIRSNRRQMLPRARFLFDQGYSSLAIDLQAHSESPGEHITFGYRESASARGAVSYLRDKKKCQSVVAIGISLGGAAALLGPEPLKVDGYVLESVYPGIEKAVSNRLKIHLGDWGAVLAPLLYLQIPLRLGIDLNELQPAEAVRHVNAPVMIMNGTEDRHSTPNDARSIHLNAPDRSSLVWFDGASHIDLFAYDQQRYKSALLDFLELIDRGSK